MSACLEKSTTIHVVKDKIALRVMHHHERNVRESFMI